MQQILSITEARNKLPSLVDDVMFTETFITVKGKVKAVLIDPEEYESLIETLEVLSDPETMKALIQSEKDLADGKFIPWEKVKADLGLD